jgi:hypothetical protein
MLKLLHLLDHHYIERTEEEKDKMSISNKGKSHSHTEETKQKLSKVAKERNLGGYVKGSGRGKKGWYKGIFCDSSWELAFVIFCLETNKKIKRNELDINNYDKKIYMK